MTDDNTALAEINEAQLHLDRANTISEMINLRDQFMALQILANAQGQKEVAQKAKIYQLKAERKAGEWLSKNVNAGNPQFRHLDGIGKIPDGIKENESRRWQLEAKVPEEIFNKWVDECLETGKEITASGLQRKAREINKENNPSELPTDKFRVVYADPPWQYGNTMPDYMGVQDDHYKLMSLEDICNLPIKNIIEDNAVLFLWVTSPILEDAFKVVNSWGFEYKASFIWDKVKHVMGHYNSVRHEFLFVCIRGSCPLDVRKLYDSVISIERTEHSEKPEYFREIIDTIYPNGKRIELFSRKQIDGWTTYGNEIAIS